MLLVIINTKCHIQCSYDQNFIYVPLAHIPDKSSTIQYTIDYSVPEIFPSLEAPFSIE